MRVFSICLDKIPEEKINVGKDGRRYLNCIMHDNEQPDQFGNDFSVQIKRTKEQREKGEKPIYLGNGKNFKK